MARTGLTLGRVVAVVAATLLGAVLTAALLGGRLGNDAPRTQNLETQPAPAVQPSDTLPSPAPSTASTPATADAGIPAASARIPETAAPAAAGPTRVALRRLGVDMAVEAQGVDDRGQMGLPANPAVAGWYRYGAAPSDASGAVVVAAHVDSRTYGVGPFARLASAKAGDEVDLWVGGARVTYRVSQVARVDKATLDADGLFSLAGSPRLHLVTCTGDYSPSSGYTQNLVIVADRVST